MRGRPSKQRCMSTSRDYSGIDFANYFSSLHPHLLYIMTNTSLSLTRSRSHRFPFYFKDTRTKGTMYRGQSFCPLSEQMELHGQAGAVSYNIHPKMLQHGWTDVLTTYHSVYSKKSENRQSFGIRQKHMISSSPTVFSTTPDRGVSPSVLPGLTSTQLHHLLLNYV
jgi:hypothetical protein